MLCTITVDSLCAHFAFLLKIIPLKLLNLLRNKRTTCKLLSVIIAFVVYFFNNATDDITATHQGS